MNTPENNSFHKHRSIIDKIWDSHVILQRQGHPAIFAIDFMLLHEVTSAQAFEAISERGVDVYSAGRLMGTIDHSIPTSKNRFNIIDDQARTQVDKMRENSKKFGIPLYDFESGKQGIVHVVGPELGFTQPGMTIVCGDSHTSTHGAFGALAFGVGTTEVEHVLASQALLRHKPKSMLVKFTGTLKPGVFAKDAILKLIASIGIGGATGHVIEYRAIDQEFSMEERMTICNMSIECGARAGLFGPDEVTLKYLKNKPFAPTPDRWEEACKFWLSFASDKDAPFDKEVVIDLSTLCPMVTWGTNPGQGIRIDEAIPKVDPHTGKPATASLEYVKLQAGDAIKGTPIQWAFLGSCTNGRISDLRIAASILKDKKVNSNVKFYIVPGSEAVLKQAIAEGLNKVFTEAGADFRMPGCSMCLGMNEDKVTPGQRCISSSNRNFVGRQGTGSITHLASPATVVASAIAGHIDSPEKFF
jgi:3-isopropylmalate/(R)-2-methylmalate dehydratase large subunit